MRSFSLLLASLVIVGCGKGGGAAAPAAVSKVSILKGLTPTKTIPSSLGGGDLLRYEIKQPPEAVVASVRKDAQANGWKESAPMGHPVFVGQTAEAISNVDVEGGKLSADGLTLTPDAGTTVVTVSETPTGGKTP